MKNLLLPLIFFTSVNSSVIAQSNSDLFMSILDMEKLTTFKTSEFTTYMVNNGFTANKRTDSFVSYIRERNGEILIVKGGKGDLFDISFSLGTTSKERYMNIKNSLSAEGYVYRYTSGETETYKKPSGPIVSISDLTKNTESKVYVIAIDVLLKKSTNNSTNTTPAKEQSANQPYNSNKAGGWQTLFNGKNLDGWQIAENPASFSVQDGAIMVSGPRAHLFYDGPIGNHNFKNFEWKATVKTMPGASSGMFIHTDYQDEGWPNKGYRIQVNQTHADWRKTGSVYAVRDVKELFVKDEEWYTVSITVKGNEVTIRVNDKVINNYVEPDSISTGTSQKKLSTGTVALQSHDPQSKVFYRDVMLRILPD